MNLLIIGASGGTGRELVKQALEYSHNVTAFVRNPEKIRLQHANLTVAKGNVLDPDSVDSAVMGQDAVLSALGHKKWFIKTTILSEGTRNIVSAMEKHGVKRFICETTLGIGDTRGRLGLYYTLFVIPVITYFYFKDKEKQEHIIAESSLDWTIVRPGQLTNGRKKDVYRHGESIGSWIFTVHVSRADVAGFMLKQLTDNSSVHRSPAIAY
ncbi:MAG: SDR family oxidoreductase [Ignavibacteriales bacterium]|nr:SDR family oxidoreductase [Ignavibacteriales bacterium]